MLEAFLERLDRRASQERKNLMNCKRILSRPSRADRRLDDAISFLSEELVRFNDLIEREGARQQRTQIPAAPRRTSSINVACSFLPAHNSATIL
jgi:hypothetical protein